MNTNTRAGFIAILGLPNAGKSTLMNALIGQKIAITSKKVQTTRHRILGITIHENSQLIFMDTPGIFNPKKTIEKAMVGSAMDALKECDLALHLIDVSSKDPLQSNRNITEKLDQHNHCLAVLNKIDTIEKSKLLTLADAINETGQYQSIFMISGLKKRGLRELTDYCAQNVPESPFLFEEDQMTDMPLRMIAAEITREKVFEQLHQELPYNIGVVTENWEERKDGSVLINQMIIVEKDSQKGIVLGKGGSRIKKLGQDARKNIEDFLGRQTHLKLFVKVEKNWSEKPSFFSMMGLNFPT